MVKVGSLWRGNDEKSFRVIGVVEIEGKNWVYYRLEKPQDHMSSEFSCYEESFVTRFIQLPE